MMCTMCRFWSSGVLEEMKSGIGIEIRLIASHPAPLTGELLLHLEPCEDFVLNLLTQARISYRNGIFF